MKQTFKHRPGLHIEAEFSKENSPVFRYRLSATKTGASNNPKSVCAIMQNPSYACVEFADKSVQVLERVVFEKPYPEFEGVERLIIVNQFAFIQTNDFAGRNDQVGRNNDAAIESALSEAEIILLAWGKDNGFSDRKETIERMIEKQKDKVLLQLAGIHHELFMTALLKNIAPNKAISLGRQKAPLVPRSGFCRR
ncbi:hypothetical protein BIU88_08805 [Chlorobaculum limnaeum]|uniref:DUF1643 domain-containing protein n=1 Tax=Chlorobaculum limnaeum TaxID=274537 RepID=A0A1D8D1E6_CHLLM|nr:DUF1643 domain-containing protein [Chlorobaculum limnaeum]AOS84221.1 hypothetical protein BIU88_08805 [Chlorobaculum limnaeum]